MQSKATPRFWKCYRELPQEIKRLARKNYRIWKNDPYHPSLHFQKMNDSDHIYSVRIGLNWRALGLLKGDTVYWAWIGSHEEYNQIKKRM